jgi:hypothetical protein
VGTETPFFPHDPDRECEPWRTLPDEEIYDPLDFGLGHIHALDAEAPTEKRKRRIGFVTEDDYVRGGTVKQYKRKRKR